MTRYVIGLVKSLTVVPLTCGAPATVTLAPVAENDAVSSLIGVPAGTSAAIEVPLIVAVMSAPRPGFSRDRKTYLVIALAVRGATATVTL